MRGVLLAAGMGRRFGADKLLARLPDGTPLALAAARNLNAALPGAVAVVRPGAGFLAGLLREAGLTVVVNPAAGTGMGGSLARGVAAAGGAGWVIALADMPLIRPATIRTVARAIDSGAPLAAPLYGGQRGHPVGFGAAAYPHLVRLSGEQGGREVLRAQAHALRLLPVDDPGVLVDVDRPEDLSDLALADA